VEGCRSHGAGLLRALLAAGQQVVEAGRPRRVGRRPGGKSDPADVLLAACTALAADHHARPRSDGDQEALRILLVAREHANTTRTAAINVVKALLLTAPDQLREPLRRPSTPRQTAALRPATGPAPPSGSCARPCAAWPDASGYWTRRSAPTNGNSTPWSTPSCPRCSTSRASARSTPPT
jgi:hypothetical protein